MKYYFLTFKFWIIQILRNISGINTFKTGNISLFPSLFALYLEFISKMKESYVFSVHVPSLLQG